MALTDRDREILRLAAKGFSDYRIARVLRVNSGTVSRQRKRALLKLEKAKADLDFAANLERPSR
jgi:DNA-binding NarL/FixJ family response regulator